MARQFFQRQRVLELCQRLCSARTPRTMMDNLVILKIRPFSASAKNPRAVGDNSIYGNDYVSGKNDANRNNGKQRLKEFLLQRKKTDEPK